MIYNAKRVLIYKGSGTRTTVMHDGPELMTRAALRLVRNLFLTYDDAVGHYQTDGATFELIESFLAHPGQFVIELVKALGLDNRKAQKGDNTSSVVTVKVREAVRKSTGNLSAELQDRVIEIVEAMLVGIGFMTVPRQMSSIDRYAPREEKGRLQYRVKAGDTPRLIAERVALKKPWSFKAGSSVGFKAEDVQKVLLSTFDEVAYMLQDAIADASQMILWLAMLNRLASKTFEGVRTEHVRPWLEVANFSRIVDFRATATDLEVTHAAATADGLLKKLIDHPDVELVDIRAYASRWQSKTFLSLNNGDLVLRAYLPRIEAGDEVIPFKAIDISTSSGASDLVSEASPKSSGRWVGWTSSETNPAKVIHATGIKELASLAEGQFGRRVEDALDNLPALGLLYTNMTLEDASTLAMAMSTRVEWIDVPDAPVAAASKLIYYFPLDRGMKLHEQHLNVKAGDTEAVTEDPWLVLLRGIPPMGSDSFPRTVTPVEQLKPGDRWLMVGQIPVHTRSTTPFPVRYELAQPTYDDELDQVKTELKTGSYDFTLNKAANLRAWDTLRWHYPESAIAARQSASDFIAAAIMLLHPASYADDQSAVGPGWAGTISPALRSPATNRRAGKALIVAARAEAQKMEDDFFLWAEPALKKLLMSDFVTRMLDVMQGDLGLPRRYPESREEAKAELITRCRIVKDFLARAYQIKGVPEAVLTTFMASDREMSRMADGMLHG